MIKAITATTTVPYSSAAAPKTGGSALACHSLVVRKSRIPTRLIASHDRATRKTKIKTMTTSVTEPAARATAR